jgi:RNA polymerase sigma-70 factor (ECF subfamily)
MQISDAELVAQALKGDRGAAEEVVSRYQRLVFNILYHYLGPGSDIEDLAQEVFLKFFKNLERYDPKRPLKHWLARIASNQCIDEIRKRQKSPVRLESDLDLEENQSLEQLWLNPGPESGLTDADAERCMNLLQKSMEVLSPKDRMAFVLREVEDRDYGEVAAMMGSSELAARIRVSRARKQLRKELEGVLR